MLMAQPRIFYTMSRDGLLPRLFGRVHSRYHTPHVGTVIVAATAATLAALFPIGVLGDLVAMGTLLAFATVCVGVLVLRYTRPELPRPFRVKFAPFVCIAGALSCLTLFSFTFAEHWRLLVGWLLIGVAIYAGYGYRHSRLRTTDAHPSPATGG
jgi:basic amino acid/polyamine antiporter, APA family